MAVTFRIKWDGLITFWLCLVFLIAPDKCRQITRLLVPLNTILHYQDELPPLIFCINSVFGHCKIHFWRDRIFWKYTDKASINLLGWYDLARPWHNIYMFFLQFYIVTSHWPNIFKYCISAAPSLCFPFPHSYCILLSAHSPVKYSLIKENEYCLCAICHNVIATPQIYCVMWTFSTIVYLTPSYGPS